MPAATAPRSAAPSLRAPLATTIAVSAAQAAAAN
jgi:hypothetical protein